MDVRCICGAVGHIDDEFAYFLHCEACDRVFAVNPNVQLIELTKQERLYTRTKASPSVTISFRDDVH